MKKLQHCVTHTQSQHIELKKALSPRPLKKGQQALYVYSIANFVAS